MLMNTTIANNLDSFYLIPAPALGAALWCELSAWTLSIWLASQPGGRKKEGKGDKGFTTCLL